jgi:UDP-2,3-diacylglucosamine pyrophosphatase LpxH
MTKQELITAIAEKIRKEIPSVVKTVSLPVPKIPQRGKFDEEEFVLLISDIQIGHKTKTFNIEVAKKRGEILIDRLAKITAIHRASHPVNNINLFLLGDLIHNETIGRFLDLDEFDVVVKKQVFEGAIPIVSRIISFCAQNFRQVNIWTCHGNHGNMGKFAATSTNFDDVIYEFLRSEFKGQKNVHFHLTENFFQIAKVMNTRFLLVHGDNIRMWMNIPTYGITQRLMRWQGSIGQFDVMTLGHFHNFVWEDWNDKEFVVNGTWVTDDDWVRKNMGLTGSCVQVLMSVHPRQGITFTRKIKLWR